MNQDENDTNEIWQWIAGRTAKYMFWMSIIFLVCVSCLVVLWVDVPNLQENAAEALGAESVDIDVLRTPLSVRVESIAKTLIVIIWPIIILESILHWLTRPWDDEHRKYHWFGFLFCLCPALRMCARLPEMGGRIWLPRLGWRRVDKRLRRRLERTFSIPMIFIALMVLPILVVEFFLKAQVARYAWLRFFLHVGTGVIWFAFAAEFILMVSVAEKKLAYCKKHWVDLAIILLPFVSFLRSLRALRATRLTGLMRVKQMTRLGRVYRLRGTIIKAIQGLVLLDVFSRWIHRDPVKRIEKMKEQLAELETQARALRRKITRLEIEQSSSATDSEEVAEFAEESAPQETVL